MANLPPRSSEPDRQECDCPAGDGVIRHQRATCTDPVARRLGWFADGDDGQCCGRCGSTGHPTWAHGGTGRSIAEIIDRAPPVTTGTPHKRQTEG